jgi:FKBP-type peptidyl-prolyl cis-trans isomerase
MRLISPRFSALTVAAAGVLLLAACSDGFSPQVIEETDFASALQIDLSAMTKTASGLYIETVAEGAGDPVAAGHTVTVTYTGLLASGITFDPGNAPLTFTLGTGQVVAGFDEGVTGMKLGGIRIVIIPPGLAYGERAIGAIPAGSILIFRIELTDIAG